MKEYTYTMTIEEVSKRMSKGLATPDEVTQYTAEPPILPAWRVVELELSDVPEFIEKNGIFQFKELELSNPFTNYKNQTGEKIDFCIPNEVANEIAQQINAQHKADYFTKVEQEFTRMKNEQTDRLMDSPDHERGRLIAAERWERILNGRDTDGLQKEEINLRTAWADITEGICYIGGQRHRDRRKALQLAASPYMANCGNGFAMEKKVDNQLRGIYIRARASYQLLQWLKELQANPMADTTTQDTETKKPNTPIFSIIDNDTLKALHVALSPYFKEQGVELLKVLNGQTVDARLKFSDNQNKLVEVFNRAMYNGKTKGNKTDLANWLFNNFEYWKKTKSEYNRISKSTVRDALKPDTSSEPSKTKIIVVKGLEYRLSR